MTGPARIRLCGPLAVDLGSGPLERLLPGRQGRLVVAYLVYHRARAVTRDELIELLWPRTLPSDPGETLSALLSKVRAVLGADALAGRSQLRLAIPAWVDVEAAAAAVEQGDGTSALAILDQGFLPGEDGPWAAARRAELEELTLRALEGVGDEPSARRLIAAAPFRERGHVLLMEALAAGGNVAEALRVYERLRVLLRDDLGAAPGEEARRVHARLLGDSPSEPVRDERKLITVVVAELDAADRDPERLHAALADAREQARAAIERHGGAVHRALGSLLVAVFGAPTAHEDDEQRALRAAAEIAGRAGVASGEALVRANGVVEGEAITRALALQQTASPGTVAVDAPAPRALSPFVGRRRELAHLREAHGLLAVVGEAGVGKTRLTTTFTAGVDGTVLTGRCLPYGRGITWWPLREALLRAAPTPDDLRRLAGDDRVADALALTVGLESRLTGAPPSTLQAEIEHAWTTLLLRLKCAVLLVDDVHHAEPPLLDLLELLAARTPALVLVTARTLKRDWPTLALEPLPRDEADELAAHLLADARVTAHAEGNPFFLEQLAHHVDDGAATLPPSVRSLLAARLDALGADAKRTLQDAAVIGRAFAIDALEAMRPGAPVRAALAEAQARGLINGLAFRHGLIREVAYQSLPLAERGRAHAAVARWLGERPGLLELKAHHLEAAATLTPSAQARGAAVDALLVAGRAAPATADALTFAERALALASLQERPGALAQRASALHAAARGSEALAAYLEAIDGGADPGRMRALALLLCARYTGTLAPDDHATAIRLLEDGLRETDLEDVSFETGALLVGRAFGLPRWGRPRPPTALRDVERAVEIAEAIGSGALLANALEALSWVTLEAGFGQARELGERLVASANRIPDRDEAHENLAFGAICLSWGGAHEHATAAAARAAALASGPHRALHAAAAQTVALLAAGRLDALAAATADVLEWARNGGLCATAAVGLAGQAVARLEASEDAQPILDVLDQAWPTLGGVLYPSLMVELLLPFLGVEAARARLAAMTPRGTPGAVGLAWAAGLLAVLEGGDASELAPGAYTAARVRAARDGDFSALEAMGAQGSALAIRARSE